MPSAPFYLPPLFKLPGTLTAFNFVTLMLCSNYESINLEEEEDVSDT